MDSGFKNKTLLFYGPDQAFDFHKGNNTEMMISCSSSRNPEREDTEEF